MTRRAFSLAVLVTAVIGLVGGATGEELGRGSLTSNIMPTHFGSVEFPNDPAGHWDSASYLAVMYAIDYETAAELLPFWTDEDGMTYGMRPMPALPNGMPVLTVVFAMLDGVDWLGGGGYNLVGISLTTEFIGKKKWKHDGDRFCGLRGQYAIAAWEDETFCIILGREIMGVPKLYATFEGDPAANASFFDAAKTSGVASIWGSDRRGQPFLKADFEVSAGMEAVQLPPENTYMDMRNWGECNRFETMTDSIGWKYIPRADFGQADLSYAVARADSPCPDPDNLATCCPPEAFDTVYGNGWVTFPQDQVTKRDFPSSYHIVNKLKDVVENHCHWFPNNALLSKGCGNLMIREQHAADGIVRPRKTKKNRHNDEDDRD